MKHILLSKFLNMLNFFAYFFKIEILTKNELKTHLGLKEKAIFELAKLHEDGLKKGLTCVVFSKDRAMQLYAHLETHIEFLNSPVQIIVIYKATTVSHSSAYDEVKHLIRLTALEIDFVQEKDGFRNTLLNVLSGINTKNMFYMSDDEVFIGPLNLDLATEIDPSLYMLSFRLSPKIKKSYTGGVSYSAPNFSNSNFNGLLEFNWFEKTCEWSYPWATTTHVFSTSEIYALSKISDYKGPNSYEGAFIFFNHMAVARKGLCYDDSIVLNTPLNKVQDEVNNKSGSLSSEYLLHQWNKGLKICIDSFKNISTSSTHEEIDIIFIKR